MRWWRRFKAHVGWGKSVKELGRRLDMDPHELGHLKARYQEAHIPKRRGGVRRLLIPSDGTKAVQRAILKRLLGRLRAHPAATGFERGKSIVDNARPHVGRHVVIKMDVKDFFPATTEARVERYFRRIGWNKHAAKTLTSLTSAEGGLPQGAPTSPRLSNLVNFGLDARMQRMVEKRHGRYTRYADDITISFQQNKLAKKTRRRVRGTIQLAAGLLKAHGYYAHRNTKLKVCYRHRRQMVTGLVVNDKVQLPRARRRWLRAVEHRAATGGEPTITPAQLQGWRALQQMVERG